MEALVKMIAEQTGIDERAAQQAVEIVIDQLKSRLPGPMAAQVEGLLSGDGGGGGSDVLGGLGSKLGL